MAETIAVTLLDGLEDWLKKVESTEENKNTDRGQNVMNGIAVNALFNQMAIIIQVIGTDAKSWGEVVEFTKKQTGRYKSQAVHGCLKVLAQVAEIVVPLK